MRCQLSCYDVSCCSGHQMARLENVVFGRRTRSYPYVSVCSGCPRRRTDCASNYCVSASGRIVSVHHRPFDGESNQRPTTLRTYSIGVKASSQKPCHPLRMFCKGGAADKQRAATSAILQSHGKISEHRIADRDQLRPTISMRAPPLSS